METPIQTNFAKALVKGQKYQIIHRLDYQRKHRSFVGVYLGYNPTMDELTFSLRPYAGTSGLKERDIISSIASNKPCGIY